MGLLLAAIHYPHKIWLSDRRGLEVSINICCILWVLSTCGQAKFAAAILGKDGIVQTASCLGFKAIVSDVMGHAAKACHH